MARLSADVILSIAGEYNLEAPRIIKRKVSSGAICYVLKWGPSEARSEAAYSQAETAEQIRASLEALLD